MKYDLKSIMTKAWEIYRKPFLKCKTFAEALHRAWLVAKQREENEKRVKRAIAENGITERVRTWFGWTTENREVVHGCHNLFKVLLLDGTKGDGVEKWTPFFGLSQTAEKVA